MTDKLTTIPEIKSLTDIVRHSSALPTLRNADQKEVDEVILKVIVEVFLQFGESPDNAQVKLLHREAKEALQGLTIPDIEIFKRNCLQGEYPLKFRLTNYVFIEWIKEYKFQRGEAFASMNHIAHIDTKKDNEFNPKTIELLKGLADKVKKNEPKNEPIPENEYLKLCKKMQSEIEKYFDENSFAYTFENGQEINIMEFGGKRLVKSEYVAAVYEQRFNNILERFALQNDLSYLEFFENECSNK